MRLFSLLVSSRRKPRSPIRFLNFVQLSLNNCSCESLCLIHFVMENIFANLCFRGHHCVENMLLGMSSRSFDGQGYPKGLHDNNSGQSNHGNSCEVDDSTLSHRSKSSKKKSRLFLSSKYFSFPLGSWNFFDGKTY